MDACKTNVLVSLFRANFKKRFVSGPDFSRAVRAANEEGFSPCGAISLSARFSVRQLNLLAGHYFCSFQINPVSCKDVGSSADSKGPIDLTKQTQG
jgi:hypothetical protein